MFNPISNNEKQFLLNNLIKHNFREGRRALEEFRDIKIRKLDENGQVEIKIGNTLVISQIFAKLITPNKERPNEGVIVFSVDSNNLRPNAEYTQSNEDLSEMRNKLSNLLEKSLKESKALDGNSLCVVPGKLVWKIVLDINIINNDGNLYDSCMLASLASWMSFKIPFLRKSGTKIDLTNVSKAQQINLSTLHVPLSVTFGLYDNNSKYIVDPNLKEEQCIDGVIIISANKFNEICYLHTYGSVKVDQETVSDLMLVTKDKILELSKILKEFVETQKVPMIRKKETSVNKTTTELTPPPQSNDMIIDDDNLEYSKMNVTSNSSVLQKKPGFMLYEIKNN